MSTPYQRYVGLNAIVRLECAYNVLDGIGAQSRHAVAGCVQKATRMALGPHRLGYASLIAQKLLSARARCVRRGPSAHATQQRAQCDYFDSYVRGLLDIPRQTMPRPPPGRNQLPAQSGPTWERQAQH